MTGLRKTPFYPRTFSICQSHNWRRWSGYLAASSYELTHDREYHAVRSSAALLDVTPLYKYIISGPDSPGLMNRIVTRDVSKCSVGQIMYTPWCDEDGKVLDDGTLQRLEERKFRLTSADPNFEWLGNNAFRLNVEIKDDSDTTAALAIQGPNSRNILNQCTSENLDKLKFFHLTKTYLNGIPAVVSRTGYTGDLGYEIWVETNDALSLWDLLMETGESYGITPAGILALDIARIEAGLILMEVDYISSRNAVIPQRKSSPYEIGLGWAVNLKKGEFNGRSALVKEKQEGSKWKLAGLDIAWEPLEKLYNDVGLPPQLPTTAWRTSTPIYSSGKQIGYSTSGCWSPVLKKYIALAHLKTEFAKPGTEVFLEVKIEHFRKETTAAVVKTPFFDPERKRSIV